MKNKSLKFNIFILFLIPTIVFLYFSYLHIQNTYKMQKDALGYKYSIKIIEQVGSLIHTLQLERGLSTGYLVSKNPNIKKNLLKQYKSTNLEYKKLINLIHANKTFSTYIENKSKKLLLNTLKNFNTLRKMREQILHKSINFKNEINYYTAINRKLILCIKNINMPFSNIHQDLSTIEYIQKLKEIAGLERAYIYNKLLTNDKSNKYLDTIKQLQNRQKRLIQGITWSTTPNSLSIYNSFYSKKVENRVQSCVNGVLEKKFTSVEAERCFHASSQYINIFEKIYTAILKKYIKHSEYIYMNALQSFYIALLIWGTSIFAILLLLYILIRIIKKDEKNREELKIAAFTFEAYEGIVITDTAGTILKVNKSFSKITGYTSSEIIGKNTRLLKSNRHPQSFYKNLWQEIINKGRWQSEIFNKRKNGETYPEMLSITAIKDEENITTHYIAQFLDISELRKTQEMLQYQADHDFLTGLLNRKSLQQRLHEEYAKAKRHHFIHAFIFIDLDNFKLINDNYGHDIGDKLIIEVANRLRNSVRQEDIVARISGDEFGILLLNLNTKYLHAAHAAKQICNKILKEISKELFLEKNHLTISSSIGIKLFPTNKTDVNNIIIHADKAMYQAKKQGRNQFVFFNKVIEQTMQKISILEFEIKESLENKNFLFYFQPKVDINSKSIIGAEILIRWQHPTKGLLFPESFIQEAENLGLIHHFFTQALHTACTFLKEHKDTFHGNLSINVSSQEILHQNFTNEVSSNISAYNIDASKIELEILESSLIKNFDLIIKKITKLQEVGIKFSIDDFGIGYSSMSYLQKLPIDTLKIDKSFLSNFKNGKNEEFIKIIIKIAEILNLNIIAEGVENEAQLHFLQQNSCKYYQGFYFSKAVSQTDFLALLKKK